MSRKSKVWSQYEAGLEYKRRIGLYENNRRNERFYRGDQWHGAALPDLPKPVFNVIRRVIDFLVSSIALSEISIRYTDEAMPFISESAEAEKVRESIDSLNANAAFRWEKNKMQSRVYTLLSDAAVSGDGVLYCYWDPNIRGGQGFDGDIAPSAHRSSFFCRMGGKKEVFL